MKLERCSSRFKMWQRSMLFAGVGFFVAVAASSSWSQVPDLPAVPDGVDAAVDAATDTANEVTDAAADVTADAAATAEAGVENAVETTTQAGVDVDAATDAAADVGANLRADTAIGPQAAANIDVDANTQTRFGAAASMRDGTLVLGNVASGSVAAQAGLRADDELVSINGIQVRTNADYNTAIHDAIGPATIQYRRGGQLYTARVELPPPPPPQRQQSFYRGPDGIQSGGVAQQKGPVQKVGYSDGPVQNGYYADAGCTGHRHGHHHHRHRHRHGHHRGRR